MKSLRPIFIASFFFSIHLALLTYLNATMLGAYANSQMVSVIYTFGSVLSLVLIFLAPTIIKYVGLVHFSTAALVISAVLLCTLGMSHSALIIPVFIMYFSLNTLIVYSIDLFVEHYTKKQSTGRIRGLFLTLNNIGWVLSPVLSGYITSLYGQRIPYSIAAIMVLVTLGVIALSQRNFKDTSYTITPLGKTYAYIKTIPSIRRIITVNFILQFFFAWMVLYVPLHLIKIGFSWSEIGILISIILIPFAILEVPIGKLIDRFEERPFIITGMSIMALSTLIFASIHSAPLIMFIITLFCTRVGASMLEISTDSYFFHRLTDKDTSIISVYRNMVPMAYIIAPMLGAILLLHIQYQTLFFILGGILIMGIFYTFRLYKTS
jgi:MFS family permease